ncbi:hypothetical protein HK101_002080 [Irineochytrium annulatum]|nr:hypothetical protein HK101_002080 [Irineochytrium annulatum]
MAPNVRPPASVVIFESTAADERPTSPSTLANEYGKERARASIDAALVEAGFTTRKFVPVTIRNYSAAVDACASRIKSGEDVVVLNLCDGTEDDGYPGASVVRELERLRLPFTGGSERFFVGTTSKPELKRMLIADGVATSPFVEIVPGREVDGVKEAERLIGYPMFVKPSVSYASLSISDTSIVRTEAEAVAQVARVRELTDGGIFIERYLRGREFTVLVVGDEANGIKVYPVVERVFNKALKRDERILAFDRYWKGYDLEGGNGDGSDAMYWYEIAPEEYQAPLQGTLGLAQKGLTLKDLSRSAYLACKGAGYGRVDIVSLTAMIRIVK